jgi:hypothetical protein
MLTPDSMLNIVFGMLNGMGAAQRKGANLGVSLNCSHLPDFWLALI